MVRGGGSPKNCHQEKTKYMPQNTPYLEAKNITPHRVPRQKKNETNGAPPPQKKNKKRLITQALFCGGSARNQKTRCQTLSGFRRRSKPDGAPQKTATKKTIYHFSNGHFSNWGGFPLGPIVRWRTRVRQTPPQYNTNCLSTVQCHTVQHNKIVLPLHNTIQNNPFQYNISLYSTIHHKIRHSIIQYNSLRYKKAYYNTVLPSVERNEFRSEPPVLQCQI